MTRRLPSTQDALRILAANRTRRAPRPPPPAGNKLGPLIRELDARYGQGPSALKAKWRDIVGETVARVTEPIKLTKGRSGQPGVLDLRVEGAAAALIQHQAQTLMQRINLFLGSQTVGRLRLIQGPVTPRAETKRPAKPRPTPPLDAAREAELEARLADVANPRLKATLLRISRSVEHRAARKSD
ncbi:MAG: DUF721 domain-containing protein [Asticcacaulis sp.]